MLTITEKVRQLYASGKNPAAIARELGISFSTVEKYLSKKQTIRGQCTLKARYATAELAKTEALRVATSKKIEIHIYKCPHCDGWHIASRRPPEGYIFPQQEPAK